MTIDGDVGAGRRGWRLALIAVTGLAIVLLAAQARLDRLLGPPGIVGLELAGGAARARAVVAGWDAAARSVAAFGLGLDFFFAAAYAAALAGWCVTLAGSGGFARRLGIAGAVAAVTAGVLDTVENVALAHVLLGSADRPWAAVATACAVPKFALAALAVLALVILAAIRITPRTR